MEIVRLNSVEMGEVESLFHILVCLCSRNHSRSDGDPFSVVTEAITVWLPCSCDAHFDVNFNVPFGFSSNGCRPKLFHPFRLTKKRKTSLGRQLFHLLPAIQKGHRYCSGTMNWNMDYNPWQYNFHLNCKSGRSVMENSLNLIEFLFDSFYVSLSLMILLFFSLYWYFLPSSYIRLSAYSGPFQWQNQVPFMVYPAT